MPLKHLILITALLASPLAAQEQPDFVPPQGNVVYTDVEVVVGAVACALLAAGVATGPSGAVAAATVAAAGGCTIWMGWGMPFPTKVPR